MIRFKTILRLVGVLLGIESLMLAISAGVSYYYQDDALHSFLISTLITLVAGLTLFFIGHKAPRQFTRRDGYVLVTFSWLSFTIFGTLPYLIGGHIPNVSDAFFESMSGITSTGSTILTDIDSMPHGLLFWRCFTQWLGGLGILMFTLAILPIFGSRSLQVFAAEVSGPTRSKVTPRIGVTAKWLWSLYAGFTIIVFGLLLLGGMSPFDSICHAFSTTGTGGFSTHQESIGYYHSAYIEYVITLFMFICGINFNLQLMFLQRKFRKFSDDTELRFYLCSVIVLTLIITLILFARTGMGGEESFRKALFQVVSLHTSSGLATSDIMTWPAVGWGLLIIPMMIGACAGSTSGGMKMIRWVVLMKTVKNEFRHILHPYAVLPVRINKQAVAPQLISTVMGFTMLYFIIVVICTLIFMVMGLPFIEAVGCVVSPLSNMGPGLSSTGHEFQWNLLPDAGKWLVSFLMLLGRLELFTILILFNPHFWNRN